MSYASGHSALQRSMLDLLYRVVTLRVTDVSSREHLHSAGRR